MTKIIYREKFKLTLIILLIFFEYQIEAKKLDDIFWESSNPIFDISNTDHVKQVQLLDRVTILCPQPANENFYEYSKLFVVSREGYDKCKLKDEKQLGVCANPEQQSSISLVFRDFSPLPSALQFQAGQSYYVITTSDGTKFGLNGTSDGLCATKNMKMKFDILPEKDLPQTSDFNLPSIYSDSPILYVIHTSEPEFGTTKSIAKTLNNNNNNKTSEIYFKIKEENGDFCSTNFPNLALLIMATLFVLNLSWLRLF